VEFPTSRGMKKGRGAESNGRPHWLTTGNRCHQALYNAVRTALVLHVAAYHY